MSLTQSKMFTDDFRSEPYWWTGTPRSITDDAVLPRRVDVLVIGSGYTGLCAALQTMRGGRSTVVIDAEDIGWGCSSRNGGQVSTGIKPDFVALSKRYGETKARAVLGEG
ncbi:MAG: FAD-dependent oxidoreductase, partial [Arenicellales bacterium]|nr:FAD-dependent oxidoreductase [Arenicellales bacterium]